MAPTGTPQSTIDRIHRDVVKALDSTGMRARFFVQGMSPAPMTPEGVCNPHPKPNRALVQRGARAEDRSQLARRA